MANIIIKKPKVPGEKEVSVAKTLQPVKKKDANIEAERGEAALGDFDYSGFPSLFGIGGEPHSQGGTPLLVPNNSFIFSKDDSMKIVDPTLQKEFNKPVKKSGYTPAELAKQYDINKNRKVLADPMKDKLQKDTAIDMIKNYNEKLGKLALIQEAPKGFPTGVPFVSMPYLEEMGIDPVSFVGAGPGEPETTQVPIDQQKFGGTINVRVKTVPKFGGGGTPSGKGNPKQESPAWNPVFVESLTNKLGEDASVLFPETLKQNKGRVADKQKATGKGSFGRQDWTSAELFPDFRNRNQWYFKEHPEFNPRDPAQVKDFQLSYNKKAQEMGLAPYFTERASGQPKSKYDVDSQFGEVTYSVPNLEFSPKAESVYQLPELTVEGAKESPKPLEKPDLEYPTVQQDNPYWTQDVINMSGAFNDLMGIKKYMPWQAGFSTELQNGVYYDPTRELAANSEQANIAAQTLGAFAGPQALSSRMSEIQGKALANSANILGKYNNLNVQEANQIEANRVAVSNEASLKRAGLATDLYDKTVIANQNFDNAKRAAREKFRQSVNTAITNRGKTQALNSLNERFKVDPRTGFIYGLKIPAHINPAQAQQSVLDTYRQLAADPSMKGVDPTELFKHAAKLQGVSFEDPNIQTPYMRNYNESLPR